MVTAISNVSAAYAAGLNVNDEIIAIDNYRTDDLLKATANKKPGEAIDLLVARDGLIKKISIVLTKNNNVKYKLEKLSEQTPATQRIWVNLFNHIISCVSHFSFFSACYFWV
jgi:predicted metalloprotease with PDZ domain